MANSESSSSTSSSGQFRFLDLELPTLYDQEINTQVQKTHGKHYTMLLRQPLLVSILHILKPATNFLDSILLENKSSEKENEVETSNLSEFNSTVLELNAFFGGRCLNVSSILENIPTDCWGQPLVTLRLEFSTISELRTLAGNLQFMSPIVMMDEIASYFVQMLDEINLSMEPVKISFCRLLHGGGAPPILTHLYLSEPQEEDANQNKPSNGFQGLIAMKRRATSLAVMDKATGNDAMGAVETFQGTKTNTNS
ncbi:hypothetical protein L6164_016471 [Bauhinia variegata]|uniref:Uncharacterized protein n=1 Tax=Bauhinia variegata TaxID=167791 RepID=A0ACB9NPH1_BAUVA|nr:hypothetical protein L6164_016471 [Bauhinia variegata]